MLEFLFVMALSIIGVVLAVLGVGMASRKKTKKDYVVQRVSKFNDSTRGVLGVGTAIKTFLTESTGEGTLTDMLYAAAKGERAYELGAVGAGLERAFGKYAGEVAKRFDFDYEPPKEKKLLERYASRKKVGEIYKEYVGLGKVPDDLTISIKYNLGDKYKDKYGKSPRAVQEDKAIMLEGKLTPGEIYHAQHHELEEYNFKQLNPSAEVKEGYIEGAVWAHYLENIDEHREEMKAAIDYWNVIKDTNPEYHSEILEGIAKALNKKGPSGS